MDALQAEEHPTRRIEPAVRAELETAAIAKMCCGLLGVQIVWGLQNVNTSRIFQGLGADIASLPILWIAAPITGLVVQPVIGYMSDRTWTRYGRRRPYLLAGAILSAAALIVMPNVGSLWAAVAVLWVLTASINVAMEPFRALVADNVAVRQRDRAFAIQAGFIGAGAVLASALPYILSSWLGVANDAPAGGLPLSLRVSYAIGALILLTAMSVTIFATVERSPAALARDETRRDKSERRSIHPSEFLRHGALWLSVALAISILATLRALRPELYLLAGIAALFGAGQILASVIVQREQRLTGLLAIVGDVVGMPDTLRRLCVVQFFTWFGLFTLWIYVVPAVAARAGYFDPASKGYNLIANWVGIQFSAYNAVAALFSVTVLPRLITRSARRRVHALSLLIGAAGLAGFGLVTDRNLLWCASFALGIAWASILSIPYAMVADACPPTKMGVYMGIHNVFLVLPQLTASALLGWLVSALFGGDVSKALLLGSAALLIAAALATRIPDHRTAGL